MAFVGFHVCIAFVINTGMIDYQLLNYSPISVSQYNSLIRTCTSEILTKCSFGACNETRWQPISAPDLLADRKSQQIVIA